MTVGPGVSSSGDQEPHVDLDVEEDEGGEGKKSQQDGPGDVHVVLDVDGIVPVVKKFELSLKTTFLNNLYVSLT